MKERKTNRNPVRLLHWLWLMAICVSFVTGCGATKVEKAAVAKTTARPMTPRPVVDDSLPTEVYVGLGMPDPGRVWKAADYRDCRDVLYKLDRTNRAALPRMESPKSAAVFARMINPTNALLLGERFLPTPERLEIFEVILNRLPAFRDVYRFDTRGPVFHRELIELSHLSLRVMSSAIEWDGKPLPSGPGEGRTLIFRLGETSGTYSGRLLDDAPERSYVPPGDRFVGIGAYTAATANTLLPWLADGTGVAPEDRLRAVRYLREDLPALWRHVSAANQRDLLELMGEMQGRIQREEIRRELEALRQQLTIPDSKASN